MISSSSCYRRFHSHCDCHCSRSLLLLLCLLSPNIRTYFHLGLASVTKMRAKWKGSVDYVVSTLPQTNLCEAKLPKRTFANGHCVCERQKPLTNPPHEAYEPWPGFANPSRLAKPLPNPKRAVQTSANGCLHYFTVPQ